MLDCFGQHQTAPHQCSSFVFDQHAGGDNFENSVADLAFIRDDHRLVATINLLCFQAVGHAQHARDGETPDVSVKNTNGLASGGKCGCQVHGDRGFAHTTFAARDSEDSGGSRNCCVGGVLAGIPPSTRHHVTAFFGGHFTPVDLHLLHPRVHLQAAADVLLNLGTQGASADGELDPDGHNAVGHGDFPGHSEIHDVVAQFGVDDSPKQVADLFFSGRGGNSLAHKMKCTAVSEMRLGMPSMKGIRSLLGGHHDHSHRHSSKESRSASR